MLVILAVSYMFTGLVGCSVSPKITGLAGCSVSPKISCGARKLIRTPQIKKKKSTADVYY